MLHSAHRTARIRLQAEPYPSSWFIEDNETVPASRSHAIEEDRLMALLEGWKDRTERDLQVGRELALRWDEMSPRVGVDPDVYMVETPPEGDDVTSLRTWETGHHPPLLAVEIVSPSRPDKDYTSSPLKYAASGTQELWVFDPKLAGPKTQGGPFRLQMWQRDDEGGFNRVYADEGPMLSKVLGAWVFAVDEGRSLAIADDEAGTRWWMTPKEEERAAKEEERAAKEAARADAEAERAAKEAARADAEAERAAKEAERAAKGVALQRIAELEALLAKQRG